MHKEIVEKQLIVALHRKLYSSDTDNPDPGQRNFLYNMLANSFVTGEGKLRRCPDRDEILKHVSDKDIKDAEKILSGCAKQNIQIMTWYDEEYPLNGVLYPPPIISIRGSFPDPLIYPYIAVVGSRKLTSYGKEITEQIVQGLVPYNATIVSGLAYGADGAAHNAALMHGLYTIAVLGTGINYLYPADHVGLAEKISTSGAVVSEFPWGMPPLKHNFPWRNRLISGLSRVVVVVEAVVKSGSLITAHWAREQEKEVFAVPGNVGRPQSAGTNKLIKEGAHLLENGEDLAEFLGLKKSLGGGSKKNSGQDVEDDAIKRAVLNFLKNGGGNIEELIGVTGLSVQRLLPIITEVELLLK